MPKVANSTGGEELVKQLNRLEFVNKTQRDMINDLRRWKEIVMREFNIPEDIHTRKSTIHKTEKNKFIA